MNMFPKEERQSQETVDLALQSCEQSRKEIRARHRTVMVPRKKRSKFWNYFEELKPSLVKCTTCRKEIKIPHPTYRRTIFRAHLNSHGIFLDNDTFSLPDDLKQYYSELPEYKAKCKDCGKTLSFLSNMENLREHLRRRHSTRIQSRETVTASRRRKSKFWNYFEELKPSLVKCTTCKKEIKIPYPTSRIRLFRAHLNSHGIFLDNDTLTLPNDLKQYYSELPEYKAKCNDCGKIFSFLTNIAYLRGHLRRRHSTKIQSRDKPSTSNSAGNDMDPNEERQSPETVGLALQSCEQSKKEIKTRHRKVAASRRRYSKFWNYFEELKPSLVKCTACKKEIKIPHPTNRTTIFRAHLNSHGIFLDNDTLIPPDDLKQYYSKLPGYKEKCKDCGRTLSILGNSAYLRVNLCRLSTRIQSRDKSSISSLADNSTDPSAERQSQDTSGLLVRLLKGTTGKTGAFNESSTSITTDFDTNPTAECQSQDSPDLPVQSFEQTRKETSELDKSFPTNSADYIVEPSAVRRSEEPDLSVQPFEQMTEGTSALHSNCFYYTISNTSSSTYYVVGPSAEQCTEQPGLPIQSYEQMTEETSALLSNWFYYTIPNTSSSTYYVMDPSAEHQCPKPPGLPVQSCEQMTQETSTLHSNLFYYIIPNTSSSTGHDTNPTAESQSQETVNLDPQTCEQSRKETRAYDGPSTSSLADNSIDPSADRQSQDTSDLPI